MIYISPMYACSGGRESHPTRGVGLAFTMPVILGQSLQRRERERGGREREREKERGRVDSGQCM